MLYKFSDWVEERDLAEGPLGRLGQGVPSGGRVIPYSNRPVMGRMGMAPRNSMLSRTGAEQTPGQSSSRQPFMGQSARPKANQEPSQPVTQEPITNQATTAMFPPETFSGPSKSVLADKWRFDQAVKKYGFDNPITQRQVDSLRNQGYMVGPLNSSGQYRLRRIVDKLSSNNYPASTRSREELVGDMTPQERLNQRDRAYASMRYPNR